jgi:hypothetical protein
MAWCLIKHGVHLHGVGLNKVTYNVFNLHTVDPNLCLSGCTVYIDNFPWS